MFMFMFMFRILYLICNVDAACNIGKINYDWEVSSRNLFIFLGVRRLEGLSTHRLVYLGKCKWWEFTRMISVWSWCCLREQILVNSILGSV